jgi:hypothetical protein
MLQISGGDIKEIQGSRQNKFALSLSESSVVAPRASHFFVWQWAAVRRCWFYRRCSRMQSGEKRAARSQIEFSDRLLELQIAPCQCTREGLIQCLLSIGISGADLYFSGGR